MDILGISDIDKLKVLAYDQLALLQQVQRNIDIINTRIAELQQLHNEAGAEPNLHIAPKPSAPSAAHVSQMPKANLGPFTGRSHY